MDTAFDADSGLVKRYTPLAGLIHVSRARIDNAPAPENSTHVPRCRLVHTPVRVNTSVRPSQRGEQARIERVDLILADDDVLH